MKRTRVALALVPLVPLVLFAAGCGGSTAPPDTASSAPAAHTSAPSVPNSSTPPSTASPRASLKPPTSTKEVDVKRATGNPPTVTGVRFAEHGGFDRVVIDLKGDLPSYTVRWVSELVQEGSGDPIDVKGGAYLQVTMTPASAHSQSGDPTWTGGPIFQAELGNVQNVVKTGDFEAVVGVGIVLDHKAAFRVTEHRSPNRLVVDVAHGSR
ncbi:AMIN-like domain-containing (lipo)protein [Streptosporangium sp. CA-135522]|uniref:AMIN-like domain-containing (lipo)protein n=1 Tax=Streptosporangium sp. CA-135522 TaxID=3240072 RepID=UPI003D8F5A95